VRWSRTGAEGTEELSALAISVIAFAVVVAGAWLGAILSRKLPKHHLDAESKDMVKVGIGFLATLAALVLGLLIASAKSSFDTRSEEIQQSAAKIILLDRNLRRRIEPGDYKIHVGSSSVDVMSARLIL